jgi:hypothetical protein
VAYHLRRQIRDAVVAALGGLSTTGSNVFGSRVTPLQDANLPALLVSTPAEDVEIASMGANRTQERTLQLVIEACVKAASGYEDTVDQIVKEVEQAFAAAPTLGGLCKYMQLRKIETELSGEGEKPVAVATMTFDVPYYTALNAPDVAL